MRRGRIMIALAAAFAAALVALPAAAFADGGTPMDICQDLQDGKLDGTYTVAQLQAFFTDPSVQGYCSPVVVVTPPTTPPPVTTTTSTPAPTPPPPVTTTTQAPTPAPPPAPVTPVVITAVKGATHTSTPVPVAAPAAAKPTGVKGAQHTVSSPPRAAAAPLSTARKQGTLPFTGAQLALFLLVGLGLVATGLVLRATGRRRPEA